MGCRVFAFKNYFWYKENMNGKISNSTLGKPDEATLEKYFDKNKVEFRELFDAISLGIVLLNHKQEAVLFSNKYFNTIVKDKEQEILAYIFQYIKQNIENPRILNKSHEAVIYKNGRDTKLGFTAHRVSNNLILIFIRPITSKSIYLESKQTNQFFDKWSELVAEMAHEIANPLSGINTSLQVMLHNITAWPLEKIQSYIERTINEINRLSNFLKRIREVSSENKLDIEQNNLRSLIHNVLLQNEELLKQKKINCINTVDKNINVLVDEVAFHQIILNLLKNSLQMLSPGKEIKIYEEGLDDFYVKLVYRNNGPPIPEELMEKIFSPLYTTKDRRGGIGLAISLKLMTRMGGTIKAVPPEDGVGAKFLIYIPY